MDGIKDKEEDEVVDSGKPEEDGDVNNSDIGREKDDGEVDNSGTTPDDVDIDNGCDKETCGGTPDLGSVNGARYRPSLIQKPKLEEIDSEFGINYVDSIETPKVGLLSVSMSHACTKPDYIEQRRGKCVVGLLMSVKHFSSKQVYNTSLVKGFGGDDGFKKQRTSGSFGGGFHSYDRIFTFADLRSNYGRCFVVITPSAAESQKLLSIKRIARHGIGHVFLLVEPAQVTRCLGNSNSVLILDKVKMYALTAVPKVHIPTVPFKLPSSNATRYFSMHNMKVHFFTPQVKEDTCQGDFCDRKFPMGNGSSFKCGCLQQHRGFAGSEVVLEFDIKVDGFYQGIDNSRPAYFQGFRSNKTTTVFVGNGETLVSMKDDMDVEDLTKSVKAVEYYINSHGGWTVVGRSRAETTRDMSNEKEDIANEEVNEHIILLTPTDTRVLGKAGLKERQFAM